MQLMNCGGCGKLQLGRTQVLCQDCLRSHMELGRRIRDFMSSHPRATVIDICREMGVSLQVVNEYTKRA
ncbi:hypothetical protein [Paenibacillus sp. YYML68]|uniref:hypothetical protein n=1 Tax=Paenibacillus sp. YYML68 TaxID=2909250 RepID=UPI00248FF5EC|nr:hypothetical protein [Paenibacillus sp. YYML68]